MNIAFVVNSYVNEQGDIQVRMRWQSKSIEITRMPASSFDDWEYSISTTNDRSAIFQDISKVISSFGQYPVSYSVK